MPSSPTKEKLCAFCGQPPRNDEAGNPIKMKSCSRCKIVFYHDVECQKKHWKVHKKACGKPNTNSSRLATARSKNHRSMTSIHQRVTCRFKELRKQGFTTHEAMGRARDEIYPPEEHEIDSGRKGRMDFVLY